MIQRTALATAALLAAAALPPAVDLQLKSSDHQSLGKDLAGFIEARNANKGTDKAQEDVIDELEKWEKKLKKDPLSAVADLGEAIWASFAYDKSASKVKKGKVQEEESPMPFAETGSKETMPYAVWAPSRYNARQAYPLILCIPEKGEKPTDHLIQTWVHSDLRDGAVLAAVTMPEDSAEWTQPGAPGRPGGIAILMTVFREVRDRHAIDSNRVYLAGRGDGVTAALVIAGLFPDRFAGVIGRSGDPGEAVPHENFRNLPTFFAGGGAGATSFAQRVEAAGYANCTVKADGTEEDLWAWIQAHPRLANPTQVVLHPGVGIGSRAYWMQVPNFDGQGTAYVKGTVDKGKNQIVVEGEGVVSVTLFLSDELVDMDKPIEVLCNGTKHVDQIPRSIQTFLGLLFTTQNDSGKLYTASKIYDLPPKPEEK